MLSNTTHVKLKNSKSRSITPDDINSLNGTVTSSEQNLKTLLQPPWVINLHNNVGLIRCHHLDKEKTISLLHSIKWVGKAKNPATIQTIGTTGTIRSARKKYLDKLNTYPLNNPKTYQK
jgi:RNase P/RNase MRP subunit POP5